MEPTPRPQAFRLAPTDPATTRRRALRLAGLADAASFAVLLLFALSPLAGFLYPDSVDEALSWKSIVATSAGGVSWALLLFGAVLRRLAQQGGWRHSGGPRGRLRLLAASPFLPLGLFLALGLLASSLSPWPSLAFLGDRVRHEGWVQYLAYAGLFASAVRAFRAGRWPALRAVWLSVAAVSAVVALAERAGLKPFSWSYPPYGASLFINRNHFGYFLCMALVLAAADWALPRPASPPVPDDPRSSPLRLRLLRLLRLLRPSPALRTALGVSLTVLLLAALAYTITRGAYVGAAAGLLALALATPARRTLRAWLPLGLSAAVFLALYAFDPMLSADRIAQILADLRSILTDPGNADAAGTLRWHLWTQAVRFIADSPWIGYGPDTAGCFLEQPWYQFVDRVHNEYLQVALSIGIPGLLAWLAFLASSLRPALPSLRRPGRSAKGAGADASTRLPLSPDASAAAAAALAYLVSAFFGNSLTYVIPFLYLLLARTTAERPSVRGAGQVAGQ